MRFQTMTLFAATCIALPAALAHAGSHTWDIVEVFSNADGTIQFIELREMNGTAGETNIGNKAVTSESTGQSYTFPAHLVGPTSNRRILLATSGFAALPGAPTPDHIIVDGFFNPAGDTLRYHVYDTWTIGTDAVPLDCINSLNRDGSTGVNSPTNYAGTSGSVDCADEPDCPADITDSNGTGPDGQVDVFDLLLLLANWNTAGTGAEIAAPTNLVDVFDLLALLDSWNNCP